MTIQESRELKHESLELLQQFQKTPSTELRNQLVQLNIGLVRKEVHHWLKQCNETYDDLLQVGCLGLIRAIERFEMSKGHAFSSFAIPYIRGEIQHYLRDRSPSMRVPRQWLTLHRQAKKVIRQLNSELKRTPTDEEIAEALDIPVGEWLDIQLALQNRSPLSLDAPVAEAEDQGTSLGSTVTDRQYRSFQLAEEDRILLQQGLAKLESGTCKVLEFVFLQDLTQKETADRLGISAVTVSRRVKKGLSTLQRLMQENDR
ncbi:RNA polymerase sigma factor SigF [Phormidium yuhuli AB48]|uniref:RNA polymerase sigma factor SigF n=1 Tax=Phormidium yuhuli AB48 TaxID=2940671 RepID=A0ABY5AMQ0_9CYAN|nr:RNA polymerase sigma factor SigF [Phormidium yuhuli]USR90469.1 RNA polymerase sigma factor SigF [Phormidium yuhuli AB48]